MDRYSRRRATDKATRRLIIGGGLFIIASILAMLAFLVFETLPLWKTATIEPVALSLDARGPFPAVDTNEYRDVLFALSPSGVARAWSVDGRPLLEETLPEIGAQRITAAERTAQAEWWVGTDSGLVAPVAFEDGAYFEGSERRYRPRVRSEAAARIDTSSAVTRISGMAAEDRLVCAVVLADGRIRALAREIEESLLGGRTVTDRVFDVPLPRDVAATAISVYGTGSLLYIGTRTGTLLEWQIDGPEPRLVGTYQTERGRAVTSLGMLLGGSSLVVGSEDGAVDIWFRASTENGELRLIRAHEFEGHEGSVRGSSPSKRNRTFVTWDDTGSLHVEYATSGKTRARISAGSPVVQAVVAPKSDAIFASLENGELRLWTLDDPHPEVSLGTLFGKVHYERFPQPEFKWQSTGGTDETETKISLIPLIVGSLKGTFYAMLFSAPVAILAALYTAVFMRPRLRAFVKPTMELMATIPSVVLGLLAGLWLAPRLQDGMPVLLLTGLFLPLFVLVAGALHVHLPPRVRQRLRAGTEPLLLLPVLAIGLVLTMQANGWLDGLFEGGFLNWLYQEHGVRYDQRNALVVGVAMGMAVIPIVFSVSEDALSAVPRHLTAGSLALGATPWQTAWRVVLPAASPGIFSALMIGFGRAVGETMIILMATGNTPILDWSLFNGFRTLSANIAVEIPEAPHGGSLYRVLFVSALLLFTFTLIVNTSAEIVSTRLRKRYSRF